MDAHFPGRVAQEFEVQAWGSELWRCRDRVTQAGIRCLGRRKKCCWRVPLSQTLSQHGRTIHGKGKGVGWHRHCCLPVSSSSDLSLAPDDYHRHQRPWLWWRHSSPACSRCERNVVLVCAHLTRASVVDDLRCRWLPLPLMPLLLGARRERRSQTSSLC
jgi:hypothetical protein